MATKKPKYTAEGPLEGISNIEDPRYQVIIHYTLPEILFLLIAGSVSYCNSICEIAAFGEEKLEWLRQYFPYKHGTPSHDTLNRVLGLIDAAAFETWFVGWVARKFDLPVGELLSIDGKRLVGSADRMDQIKSKAAGGQYARIIVNCFATSTGLVLGQKDVSSKMDEVHGAKQLVDSLAISGCCISGDANFCGRELLSLIIDQEADYLITLKGKNPKIYNAAAEAFNDPTIDKQIFQTEETGHGRHEKRTYGSIEARELPTQITESYANLMQVVEVRRERRITRKEKQATVETHYYITSLAQGIESLAGKIRDHWKIENNLHHVLDVGFGEDASRARKNNLASNLSLVRKTAINLLVPGKSKAGIKHKRMRAAFSDQRRSAIFQI
jgi:predicted transposase YbfD/YdcC